MDQFRVRPGLSVARPIIMFFFLCPFRPVCVDDAATNEAVGRMHSNFSFLLFFFFYFCIVHPCLAVRTPSQIPSSVSWIQVEGAVYASSGTKSREITAVLVTTVACKHLAPPSTVILVPVLLLNRKWQQNGPETIAPGQKDGAVLDACMPIRPNSS
jgi:hypothetical protein